MADNYQLKRKYKKKGITDIHPGSAKSRKYFIRMLDPDRKKKPKPKKGFLYLFKKEKD